MKTIDPSSYQNIVFFTGAGMSAESGVPTYRGKGGIWRQYDYEEYACQSAFERNPEKVLNFHDLRRRAVLDCHPHEGHQVIARMPSATVITQNIDGMHQRAGSRNVIELHGSLWRLRCDHCGTRKEDIGREYETLHCSCGRWLRPDITWFGDMLDESVTIRAMKLIASSDLFISIGTSGTVWPAAGYPALACDSGAFCIEINPEPSGATSFDLVIRNSASVALPELFRMK
ncbi:MAG: NAD-dependent deacylase [Chlorobiaceae bacterium]|nr:NAD-dependent deacylase [Chlorobiaceae bacterium]